MNAQQPHWRAEESPAGDDASLGCESWLPLRNREECGNGGEGRVGGDGTCLAREGISTEEQRGRRKGRRGGGGVGIGHERGGETSFRAAIVARLRAVLEEAHVRQVRDVKSENPQAWRVNSSVANN